MLTASVKGDIVSHNAWHNLRRHHKAFIGKPGKKKNSYFLILFQSLLTSLPYGQAKKTRKRREGDVKEEETLRNVKKC